MALALIKQVIQGPNSWYCQSVPFGRVSLDARASTARATAMKNAKRNTGIALSYSTQLIPGVTSVTLDYSEDKYRDFDTLYSTTKKRIDKTSSIRASYLIGLQSFSVPNGEEPYVQFAAKYASANSNIANFKSCLVKRQLRFHNLFSRF